MIRTTLMAWGLALAPCAFAQLVEAPKDLIVTMAADGVSTSMHSALPEAPMPQQPLAAFTSAPTQPTPRYALVNGQPYQQPTEHQLLRYYIHSTFGPTGAAGTVIRTLYGQAIDSPSGWDQDWAGFGERLGSNEGITIINGSAQFALSRVFREDFRYYRCPGCTYKRKIANVLLAEVTARHGPDGHRMISATPIVSHIAGTVVAHAEWYPPDNHGVGNSAGSVAAVLLTQVGVHLFEEFFLRHTEEKIPAKFQKYNKYLPGATPPKPLTD